MPNAPGRPQEAAPRSQGTWVLDGQEPVLVDAKTWGDWMDTADRRIDHTEFHTPAGVTLVRTDFIGVDMTVQGQGPFFFCTTITCGMGLEPFYSRSWADAEATHARAVSTMKARYRGAA